MDISRRNRAYLHRRHDIADTDSEFGDLLDLSEPFSWQMPQPYGAHRWRNEMEGELFHNSIRGRSEDRFPPDCRALSRAGPWWGETIDELIASPSSDAVPRPTFAMSENGEARPGPDQVPTGGYMQRDSPFSLDPVVKEEATEEKPASASPAESRTSITYVADDGVIMTIDGIDCTSIEQRCALLALAIERSRSGAKLHLEALTSATADPFSRYLSTGSYALNSSDLDIFASVPTSLLLHCQLYRLGVIYDLPDLRSQANVNIIRQCEFGCSSPEKPIELCPAISFAYKHLKEHAAVLDTIVSYCVSCFLQHALGDDAEFRQLAFDLRPFHQDLCRNSRDRDFQNETIIQMPFRRHVPETYASREDINGRAYADVVHHFHGIEDADTVNKKRKRATEMSLPLRPALLNPFESEGDPEEEPVTSPFSDMFEIGKADTSRKRRASTITQPSVKSEPDTESEYELVAAPPSVEELRSELDSDTDSAEPVVVQRPEPIITQQTRLPIRARQSVDLSSVSTADLSTHESASDSEWSLV